MLVEIPTICLPTVAIPATNACPSELSVIPDPTKTDPVVVDPDTLTFCRNVAFVFVLMFSVLATPVNADPSPAYDVAVTVPDTFTFCRKVAFVLVLIFSVAATPVIADPLPTKLVAVTIPVANTSPSVLRVIPDPTVTLPPIVDVPDTFTFCKKVAFVFVRILSVVAAPTMVAIPTEY